MRAASLGGEYSPRSDRPYSTSESTYPVDIDVQPALMGRNRLTCAFRPILAIPHIMLVGGPVALGVWWVWGSDESSSAAAAGGVFGAAAFVVAVIAWFAIVFGFDYPKGLRDFVAYYLRWRVRAVAYLTLLRDEYPPFGDGPYPATLTIPETTAPRNRLSVALRIFLVIPHIIAVCVLGIAWAVHTVVAWFWILFTGELTPALYRFGVGMMRWNLRVEAYVLLLRDEYPPFSFD